MCQVTVYAFPEYCWGITLPILAAGYGVMHMQCTCTCNAHAHAMHMQCTCCHAHVAMHHVSQASPFSACTTSASRTCFTTRSWRCNAFNFRSTQTLLLTPLTVYLTPPQVLYLPPLRPARLPTGHVPRAAHLRYQCRLLPGEIQVYKQVCHDHYVL